MIWILVLSVVILFSKLSPMPMRTKPFTTSFPIRFTVSGFLLRSWSTCVWVFFKVISILYLHLATWIQAVWSAPFVENFSSFFYSTPPTLFSPLVDLTDLVLLPSLLLLIAWSHSRPLHNPPANHSCQATSRLKVDPHLSFCSSISNFPCLIPRSVAENLLFSPPLLWPHPQWITRSSPPHFLPQTHPIVLLCNKYRHSLESYR